MMSGKLWETDSTRCLPDDVEAEIEHLLNTVRVVSAVIGLRSKTHIVLASLYTDNTELESLQKKIFKIDHHVGVAFPGYTSDGRALCHHMRSHCLNYSHSYKYPLPIERLLVHPADKAKGPKEWIRDKLFGIGLLVGGLDESGVHLYSKETSDSYSEHQAYAIGAGSREMNTYLDGKSEYFMESSRENLLKDAVFILRKILKGEKLNSSICTVSVVGVGEPFHILDKEAVRALINKVETAGDKARPGEDASGEQGSGTEPGAADPGPTNSNDIA